METSLSIFPAWLLLLRIRLVQAIHLQGDFSLDIALSGPVDKDFCYGDDRQTRRITALKRVKNTTQILYSSAIAYQLTSHSSFPTRELAQRICQRVSHNTSLVYVDPIFACLPAQFKHQFWPEIWNDITVQVTPGGLIQFAVGDRAIALWLDWLINYWPQQQPVAAPNGTVPSQTPDAPFQAASNLANPTSQTLAELGEELSCARVFAVQHAYARCCSVLALAARQGMISLAPSPNSPLLWQLTQPESLPWQELFTQSELLPERNLISQLVTVMDTVVPQSRQTQTREWWRLAEAVSQAWMQLHRDRPVLGDQRQSAHHQIYTRLGLIMATQRVLHLLLEDLLGIYAPSEL